MSWCRQVCRSAAHRTLTPINCHSQHAQLFACSSLNRLQRHVACQTITQRKLSTSTFPASTSSDVILLTGLEFFAYHGYYASERDIGQKFIVDVALQTDTRAAGISDNLNDTIHYGNVYATIQKIVTQQQFQLLEALSHTIATTLLTQYSSVTQCQVTLKKPNVAVSGHINFLGVSITRTRSDMLSTAPPLTTATQPHTADEHDAYQASSHASGGDNGQSNDERDKSDRIVDAWEKSVQDRDSTQQKLQELGDTDSYSTQDVAARQATQRQKHRSHTVTHRPKR